MLTVLYEDAALTVCLKPAGVPSQPDKTGDRDMLTLLAAQTADAVMPVHRLDRTVGGVMVFAKTKQAAAALSQAMQVSAFQKTYLAAVNGQAQKNARLTNFLLKNQRLNRSSVVHKNTPGAKEAVLTFEALGACQTEADGFLSLVSVRLLTGRHHQIRVQLAQAGLPIWGDTKYNPVFFRQPGFHAVALWAHSLQFPHPVSRAEMTFTAPPPGGYPFSLFTLLR